MTSATYKMTKQYIFDFISLDHRKMKFQTTQRFSFSTNEKFWTKNKINAGSNFKIEGRDIMTSSNQLSESLQHEKCIRSKRSTKIGRFVYYSLRVIF